MLIEATWWLLRHMPPKLAYKIVHSTPYTLVKLFSSKHGEPEEYTTEFRGIRLRNPVGLAAGLDKDGDLIWLAYKLGFGFTVVGSVLPDKHDGAEKKILKRLPNGSLVNRLGLPSKGVDYVITRLKDKPPMSVAVNIASLTLDGYRKVYTRIYDYADWIEVNVSCPNTEAHGTFEQPEWVERIIKTLPLGEKPVLVKLPPVSDRDLILEYAEIIKKTGVDGAVISNTRKVKVKGLQAGLSGNDLYPIMINMLKRMRELLPDGKSLVAVGGITTADRAIEALQYADLIEVLTALLYYGPSRVKEIIAEATKFIQRTI